MHRDYKTVEIFDTAFGRGRLHSAVFSHMNHLEHPEPCSAKTKKSRQKELAELCEAIEAIQLVAFRCEIDLADFFLKVD